jgi:hypothetical protein
MVSSEKKGASVSRFKAPSAEVKTPALLQLGASIPHYHTHLAPLIPAKMFLTALVASIPVEP